MIDEKTIIKIKKYCKKRLIKFYLSNNIKLALKLDLDGAYIPAFNKNLKHLSYSFKKILLLLVLLIILEKLELKKDKKLENFSILFI